MRKLHLYFCFVFLLLTGAAEATLDDLGNGLINDTTLNIHWLKDASMVKTSCDANDALWQAFDPSAVNDNSGRDKATICSEDGRLNWYEAEAWIAVLNSQNYLGYSNWRQPVVNQPDPSCSNTTGTQGFGVHCIASELPHLFEVTLSNPNFIDDGCVPFCLVNTGPFNNLQSFVYWTSTPYAYDPVYHWWFATELGQQMYGTYNGEYNFYVWPVHTPSTVGTAEPCNLDFDGNGTEDALTDGILFTRYLSGYTDAALINDALGTGATRTTGAEIRAFLDQSDCTDLKDVDGNGIMDVATDGLLLMRYLFGFGGTPLVVDAVSMDAVRTEPEPVRDWLAFYQYPRNIIVDSTVAEGDLIGDAWQDLQFRGLGPGQSTVKVVEGRAFGGEKMFRWNVTGGEVELSTPDATLFYPDTDIPVKSTTHLSEFTSKALLRAGGGGSWGTELATHTWREGWGLYGLTNRFPFIFAETAGGMTQEILANDGGISRKSYELLSFCPKSDEDCYQDKEPVLFVHGYTLGGFFGGSEGTWGKFQYLMRGEGYLPFEFRWRTNARFQDVAYELSLAVEEVARKANRRVHIVAHSFGGVLVRTLLQKLAYQNNKDWGRYVASVITLGTPHSGIADSDKCLHSVALPMGQDSVLFEGCKQLSCYQTGEPVLWLSPFYKDRYGVRNDPAGITADLAHYDSLLPDLDVLALIGLTSVRDDTQQIDDGDGLISGWGERFRPIDTTSTCGSRYWVTVREESVLVGDANVTERILDLPRGAFPGASMATPPSIGYRHNGSVLNIYDGILPSEVNVENAGHAGFIATRDWIRDHPAAVINEPIENFSVDLRALTPDSLPIQNLWVVGYLGDTDRLAEGYTDVDGNLSMTMSFQKNSTYKIGLFPLGSMEDLYRYRIVEINTGNLNPGNVDLGDLALLPQVTTEGTLSGQVTDQSTDPPLKSVTYTFQRVGSSLIHTLGTTDVNGAYSSDPAVPGDYRVIFFKSGYQLYLTTVTILPGYNATADFQLTPGVAHSVGALNDTGITACSNVDTNELPCPQTGYPEQDAEHGRDATHNDDSDGHAGFSFTKLDANGNPLPPSASLWSCVRDNVTGLIWEVKTNDGGIHDRDNTYRWGGLTALGSGYGIYYDDWDILVNSSNAEDLCGFSTGWRVSTIKELESLMILDRIRPVIDTRYFPNSVGVWWSSSPMANGDGQSWAIDFQLGWVGVNNVRENLQRVRLVHDDQ